MSDDNSAFRDTLEGLDRANRKTAGEQDDSSMPTGRLGKELSGDGTDRRKGGRPAEVGGEERKATELQPDGSAVLAGMAKAEQTPSEKQIGTLSTTGPAPAPDTASDGDGATEAAPADKPQRKSAGSSHPIFLMAGSMLTGAGGVGGLASLHLDTTRGSEAMSLARGQSTDSDRSPALLADLFGKQGALDGSEIANARATEADLPRLALQTLFSGRVTGGDGNTATRVFPDAKQLGDADGKVKVLGLQTVPFPATGMASTPGQTGSALVETFTSDAAWRSSFAAAASATSQAGPAGNPLHSMKIQLHPAELGAVTAKLHIIGDQLAIELQVDNDEARQRLATDSDAMVKAMRSLGYDVDRITIQHSPTPSPPANQNGGAAGRESFSQSTPGQDGNDGERSFGARQGRQDGSDGQGSGTRHQGQNGPGRSGIYI